MTRGLPTTDRAQRTVITVAAAANKGTAILMGTVMAVYIGRRGSPLAVSLVYAVFYLGLMVFSPLWGALADATGRRRDVLVATAGLAALSILPLSVVDGVWLPLGLRGLFAVFAAGFLPVMLTIVNERGGGESRGRSVGLFSSAQAIGFTAGQLLAGTLLGLLVSSDVYLVIAGLAAVVFGAGLLTEDPTPTPETDPSYAELLAEIRGRLFPASTDRVHFRENGLKWLYVAILLRNLTVLGISSLLPIYLVTRLDVSEFVMGVVLAVNPAAQMGFMYLLGRTADRVGRKPLIVSGVVGSGVHGLLMAAAVVPASASARAALAAVSMFVLAAAFSALTTGSVAFIGDVSPTDRESELLGLRSTARGLGGVIGPALFGGAAMVSSFEVTFALGSSLAFAGAVVVARRLVESHSRESAAPVAAEDD